jgi:hypothetical protein
VRIDEAGSKLDLQLTSVSNDIMASYLDPHSNFRGARSSRLDDTHLYDDYELQYGDAGGADDFERQELRAQLEATRAQASTRSYLQPENPLPSYSAGGGRRSPGPRERAYPDDDYYDQADDYYNRTEAMAHTVQQQQPSERPFDPATDYPLGVDEVADINYYKAQKERDQQARNKEMREAGRAAELDKKRENAVNLKDTTARATLVRWDAADASRKTTLAVRATERDQWEEHQRESNMEARKRLELARRVRSDHNRVMKQVNVKTAVVLDYVKGEKDDHSRLMDVNRSVQAHEFLVRQAQVDAIRRSRSRSVGRKANNVMGIR